MATATPPIVPAHDEVLIRACTPSGQPLHLVCNGFLQWLFSSRLLDYQRQPSGRFHSALTQLASDLTTVLCCPSAAATPHSLLLHVPCLPESTATIEWLRGRLSAQPHDAQLLNNFSESYVDKLKSPSSGRATSRGLQSA
jgi:hypothetical protein